MIRKRAPKLLTILATAACTFGFVLVAPADTPTWSLMPTAGAQVMPNGYDVNCTKAGEGQVVCTVAGCPRVDLEDDLAGDIVHTHINHNAAAGKESPKACGATHSETINATGAFTYSVQGCRKRGAPHQDACGAYSDYEYKPPAGPPVEQAPPVEPEAPEVVPPKQCPPGSVNGTVPADQQCQGPTNAVSMNITQEGSNANVAVTNNSALPAECAYTATKASAIMVGPATVNRNVSVGPNSTGNITDMLWPLPLVSYNATVKCTATYDGKQVTIGEDSETVSG